MKCSHVPSTHQWMKLVCKKPQRNNGFVIAFDQSNDVTGVLVATESGRQLPRVAFRYLAKKRGLLQALPLLHGLIWPYLSVVVNPSCSPLPNSCSMR